MKKLSVQLYEMEEKILHQEFSDEISELLGQELWEISADGVEHSRQEICTWLQNKKPDSRWNIKDFKAQLLSEGLTLCTYWAKQSAPQSSSTLGNLHSSLWKLNHQGLWQMVFHQTTKVL